MEIENENGNDTYLAPLRCVDALKLTPLQTWHAALCHYTY